ncbi:MAG: glycosyltransferase [Candidatus Dormibacteraeota bacterium]|uniref:Glycosyltransferase n=1 Tax=Candidatus Amunia macphersoniae TaxID=3127014 RepID=A0A934NFK6_9BACT|nr:glycosyltransferase [Candidatus Dormibacteraeota bacterium]
MAVVKKEDHAVARLGELLVRRGAVDEAALSQGLARHRRDRIPLGEALILGGAARQDDVWNALATQWGCGVVDLDNHWVDPAIANELDAADAIARRVLPIRAREGVAVVAMANPRDPWARAYVEEALGMRVKPCLSTPAGLRRRQEQVYRQQLTQHSIGLLQARDPESSAHITLSLAQKRLLLVVGFLCLVAIVLAPGTFFLSLAGAVVTLYAAIVMFRIYVTVRGAKSVDLIEVPREDIEALTDLPVYTILCPLYREAGVLPQLIKACADLEYPKSKLDVKLLLEEDDLETLDVVFASALPPNFDVIVVPAEGPRTKPKACNYGLQFARGEYCVIYDAEDIPEPDQLKKALAVFRRSPADIGCVQAKLNYYNPRQNVVTKWFSLEYTAWFDFFLPGLVDLGLPVPLGGSSNHFRTQLLRDLGAWDPNNVTEDADLGMRLHRAGYRTALMESMTLEEANSDFVNWMRQRSRWGKGYFISWLVLMRHPRLLRRTVGGRALAAIQLTLGGTFVVALLNLLVWLLTLMWIMAQFNVIAFLFPNGIYYVGMIELVFGNFFFLYMGVWCASHRRSYDLTHAGALSPVYWLMASLAMLKASLQLVTKPTFWEKTVHGLYEHEPVGPAAVELVGAASTDAPGGD